MINRTALYNGIRQRLSRGTLTQSQVDGFEAIIDAWEATGRTDARQLAYVLATAWHETGGTIRPVREAYAKTNEQAVRVVRAYTRKHGLDDYARPHSNGNSYYGRGLVQLTWGDNYKKAGKELNLPLYEQPDLALEIEVAARILVEGMIGGWFVPGRTLDRYYTAGKADDINARRIINGTDKAQQIAGYAEKFRESLV